MTIYHATHDADVTEEFRESAETNWYLFMFIGFLFYCLESLYIAAFGKELRRSDAILAHMKKRK